MLNSNQRNLFYALSRTLLMLAIFSLYSCMPQSTAPSINNGSSVTPPPEGAGNYQEPTYPLPGIFIQEGTTQSSTNLTLPVNFTDSFLVRGDSLSKYLRVLPNTTKFCIVGKYNYLYGTDKFVVLSAKPTSFTDLVNKTTEFYLKVEPANDSANQNDCLTYNLTNVLYANASNPSLSFSLTQLCSDCSTTVSSSGLKLYFINGEEVPTLNVGSLRLNLAGSSASSGNACSENSLCKARGYDCCLQAQCVSDGALRPGATSMPGFLSAQEDVRLNPLRFLVYPQYYFVCETRPGTGTTGGSSGGTPNNPDYDAATRLLENTQLYNCINKVDGEFSHCTLKYSEASKNIPGIFSAEASGYTDDVNFSSLNSNFTDDYANNIVKIIYAGKTLYEQGKPGLDGASFVPNSANDDLDKSQAVNITSTLPSNAPDANLYLTYKVDGTCETLSTSLAKCSKSYVHGSSDLYSTMWHDGLSKSYRLPSYADPSNSANLIVKVSGSIVPRDDNSTWSWDGATRSINFKSSYPIFQNQLIEITYFVKDNVNQLTKLRSSAQSAVNSMCTCASSEKCNLKPLYSNGVIANFECTHSTPTSNEPPVNQTVFVSNKNVPHRYYDRNGVNYDEDYGSAPDQEPSTNGMAFSYTNNDLLKPNNVSQYVGFNEVYGSFSKSGTYVAKPAKLVKLKKDTQYDIFVNSGSFSSCANCGSDYYSSLQKIFPQNFVGQGGGYTPDNYESRRMENASVYRADDLLYGRACFVPATMIPWTHSLGATPRDQRRARLAAQHFMFANGYNRDWYGFDYGSLIGSFDGVTWFSIGNQRRIKASTSKLFIAVNAFYGDLSIDTNFNVTVSETSAFSSDIPTHDTETDGSECQKSHYCSNDNDCFRQLGYDYSCQNVTGLMTNWPQFDSSGAEIVGSASKTLVSIIGGSNGQAKRCMYRGRGAACLNDLNQAASGSTFNSSSLVGTLTCSPNNSCTPTNYSRFNDRISRFGNTPAAQNIAEVTTPPTDTVGLGARIVGRPFDFYGNKPVPAPALQALNKNKVLGVCTPGTEINGSSKNFDLNARIPSTTLNSADKLFGVGSTSPIVSSKSLNACPATDASGTSMQQYDLFLGDPTLNMFSISQNLSSNLLDIAPLRAQNIFSSLAGSPITSIGYQQNTCLRAPGASCFSDMECAPSSLVAAKARASDLTSVLNTAEAKYWGEELVCGNPDFKYVASGIKNPNFDIKKNTCCREIGKILTVYTQTSASTYKWCDTPTKQVRVAGVNIPTNSASRYSRVHSAYDKMTCDTNQISANKKFALSIDDPSPLERMKQILGQFKTLDTLNQRTCCTKHWVRSYASENGGGHKFSRTKSQNIDKEMFKHVSWAPENTSITGVVDEPFECDPDNYANASCEVKSLTPIEEEKYLTWAGSLELIGIPQVAVKANDQIFQLVDDNQASNAGALNPLKDSTGQEVIARLSVVGADFTDSSNKSYYSAASYSKFNMNAGKFKKVFSENEFNCCLPSGQEVTDTTTAEQCCTGMLATNNNQRRCCLPDYTDITVYLNRYVSSEGRDLPDASYDMSTGYIKDPGQVQTIAAQKSLCCSGKVMTGVAISQLSIPLTGSTYKPADSLSTTRRLNYRTDAVDNNPETGSIGSIFDAGVRWNNHVYCVPADFGK